MESKARKARIELRTSEEVKEQLRRYAESQGIPASEALDKAIRSLAGTGTESGSEQKTLENELEKVDRELGKLRKEDEYAHSDQVAKLLLEEYPELGEDFRKIRLQAISDFRQDPAGWGNRFQVTEEREIAAACELASRQADLSNRKFEIEAKLGVIYGIQVKPTQRPETAKREVERREPKQLPTYRIELWGEERGVFWLERAQVRPVADVKLPIFTFPDGRKGYVYEARRSDYPKPRKVERKWADGTPYLVEWDPWRYEPVSVPAWIHLDEKNARALREMLKAAPHVDVSGGLRNARERLRNPVDLTPVRSSKASADEEPQQDQVGLEEPAQEDS